MNFQPPGDPFGALWISALVAAVPLLVVFVALGILRWKAHWAGLAGLVSGIVVASLAFRMPVAYAVLAASQGAVFGIFPIAFIVFAAIWMFQLTVAAGRFEDLRAIFDLISDDPRVQAMVIAFCFGGLLEALAGFGAPVAITAVMLIAIGFTRVRAAVVSLVANTAPVAFGAVGIPIMTAAKVSGLSYLSIGAVTGRQTAVLGFFIPFILLYLVDGVRGLRQVWPAALAIGTSFAAAKWITSNYLSVELTDVVSSLVGIGAAVVMLRLWQPRGSAEFRERLATERLVDGALSKALVLAPTVRLKPSKVVMALVPYAVVVAVFAAAKLIKPLENQLTSTDVLIRWPVIDGRILTASGEVSAFTQYTFPWLSGAGTLMVVSGVLVAAIYRVAPSVCWGEMRATAVKLRWTFATMASILGLAYVMNTSGMVVTIGTFVAGTGAAFAHVSPVLGWLGTAVTGSDTSANALFANLQKTVGVTAGIDPVLLVSANTSGGVVGKLISPQNLAIAASAVGLVGEESVLLRKTFGWSLALLAFMCLMVGLQSGPVLGWMLP